MENENYLFAEEAAQYLRTTTRKISLYRRYGLLKSGKLGKSYLYKKEWLDQFMHDWIGYDLSNESMVQLAIKRKEWEQKHGSDKKS